MSGFGGFPSSLAEVLLERATPDIFRLNAFRVTGLSAEATPREISRQVKLLQMKAKLEGLASIKSAALPLDTPPDSDAIRNAAYTLQDTEQRFLHEVFWIWPDTRQPCGNLNLWPELDLGPDGPNTVALHNKAVRAAVRAIDLEFADAGPTPLPESDRQRLWEFWNESAGSWQAVLQDETFWELIGTRARDLDDPRLTSMTIRELQSALPRSLAKIHAIQAFRSGERQGRGIAGQHAAWARQFALWDADKILLDASKVLRDRIAIICSRLEVASKGSTRDIPRAVRIFLSDLRPLLGIVTSVLGSKNVVARNLSDTVADAANGYLITYCSTTKDFTATAELLEQVRPIAQTSRLTEKITANLETARHNSWGALYIEPLGRKIDQIVNTDVTATQKFSRIKAEVLPLFKRLQDDRGEDDPVPAASRMVASSLRSVSIDLHNDEHNYELALDAINLAITICLDDELTEKLESERKTAEQHAFEHRTIKDLEPIDSAPSLHTINGWGTTLYGSSDRETRTNSYLTTRYFTAFFIPLCPLSRYRVRRFTDGRYQFLGRAPFRTIDKVHVGVFVAAILIFFVSITVTSNTSVPTADMANARPTRQSSASQTPDVFRGTAPPVAAPPSSFITDPAPGGGESPTVAPKPKVVELSSDNVSTIPSGIQELKQEIDEGRARLAQMKSELENIQLELASIKSGLEAKRSVINSMESQMRLGSEVDETSYKRSVSEHNELVRQYNSLLAERREKAREHDTLVDELNEKVRQYNQSIKRR
jgi:hypothetical protein